MFKKFDGDWTNNVFDQTVPDKLFGRKERYPVNLEDQKS